MPVGRTELKKKIKKKKHTVWSSSGSRHFQTDPHNWMKNGWVQTFLNHHLSYSDGIPEGKLMEVLYDFGRNTLEEMPSMPCQGFSFLE